MNKTFLHLLSTAPLALAVVLTPGNAQATPWASSSEPDKQPRPAFSSFDDYVKAGEKEQFPQEVLDAVEIFYQGSLKYYELKRAAFEDPDNEEEHIRQLNQMMRAWARFTDDIATKKRLHPLMRKAYARDVDTNPRWQELDAKEKELLREKMENTPYRVDDVPLISPDGGMYDWGADLPKPSVRYMVLELECYSYICNLSNFFAGHRLKSSKQVESENRRAPYGSDFVPGMPY